MNCSGEWNVYKVAAATLSADPWVGFDIGRKVPDMMCSTLYPSVAYAKIQLKIALDVTSMAASYKGVQQSNFKLQILFSS